MARRVAMVGALALAGALVSSCTSIRESRGYVVDTALVESIAPQIDNKRSVEMTLGRPSFSSQFGRESWYYVSSVYKRRPFGRPQIERHMVMAVRFDDSDKVAQVDRWGPERVVRLSPVSDKTPTLGRERSFLQDLFGNIGQVGAPGVGGTGP